MPKRISSALLVPAILVPAIAAYAFANHRAATAAPPGASLAVATTVATAAPPGLPPNHPHVAGQSPHGPHAGGALPNGENQAPPSIEWKVPNGWQTLPNPNPMRLATYRAAEGPEVSVARAGGPADANILRWSEQFEGAPQADRTEKQVAGLRATIVHIAGTYGGGMGTAEPEKHEGWAMLAAIVEAPGAPYFFKVVGPAAEVDRSRASFDALLESIAPRAAGP
jgi:hypothetical protein